MDEQTRLANMREPLAREVEARAQKSRAFAPIMTYARDVALGGAPGEREKQFVEKDYAPLRAFDEQAKIRGAARTSDLAAQKTQIENQDARSSAMGKQIDLFRQRLTNDPKSPTSKAARNTAEHFSQKLQLGIPAGTFEGMSKQQVDEHMNGLLKGALANAQSDAQRQNILAAARLAGEQANKVVSETVYQNIRNRFGQAAADDYFSTTPGNTGSGDEVIGKKELPAMAAEFKTPSQVSAEESRAARAKDFQSGATARSKLQVNIQNIRALIRDGAKTGLIAGKLTPYYSDQAQVLAKELADLALQSGYDRTDTNFQTALKVSTTPDMAKNPAAILQLADGFDAQTKKVELLGRKRQQSQTDINESAALNKMETYRLVNKKDKNDTHIDVIDTSRMSPSAIATWKAENEANGYSVVPFKDTYKDLK
jgi:hypothetical protein